MTFHQAGVALPAAPAQVLGKTGEKPVGTGLGLFICNLLVKRMGGSCVFASVEGEPALSALKDLFVSMRQDISLSACAKPRGRWCSPTEKLSPARALCCARHPAGVRESAHVSALPAAGRGSCFRLILPFSRLDTSLHAADATSADFVELASPATALETSSIPPAALAPAALRQASAPLVEEAPSGQLAAVVGRRAGTRRLSWAPATECGGSDSGSVHAAQPPTRSSTEGTIALRSEAAHAQGEEAVAARDAPAEGVSVPVAVSGKVAGIVHPARSSSLPAESAQSAFPLFGTLRATPSPPAPSASFGATISAAAPSLPERDFRRSQSLGSPGDPKPHPPAASNRRSVAFAGVARALRAPSAGGGSSSHHRRRRAIPPVDESSGGALLVSKRSPVVVVQRRSLQVRRERLFRTPYVPPLELSRGN